ncbi:leucine efflux protein LeuE [Desulfovibrio sp. OttesenSCG-928-G15]|nr:leucine efflux protein LeuE [Desulfovibrio sp. OttesenSCG-928-G15]
MFESIGVLNPAMYLAGVFLIILMPGPNSLYVLSTATRRGVVPGYKAAAGVFLGDSVIMFLAALGVDSLIRLYPNAFMAVQYAGAAYLGWLGIKALYGAFRNNGKSAEDAHAACQESPFRRALLLSLCNPKAIMFFVSFFVQFVDPSKGHPGLAFLVLAGILQIVSMTYLSALIFGGVKLAIVARKNVSLQRLGTALTGTIFVGFGLRLALKASG